MVNIHSPFGSLGLGSLSLSALFLALGTRTDTPSIMSHHMDYDAKKFPCCAPWDGTQGAPFTRRFAPQFKASLHNFQDGYSSLHAHLDGTDIGGQNGPAHPGGAPGVTSLRAFELRSSRLYGLIGGSANPRQIRFLIGDLM